MRRNVRLGRLILGIYLYLMGSKCVGALGLVWFGSYGDVKAFSFSNLSI